MYGCGLIALHAGVRVPDYVSTSLREQADARIEVEAVRLGQEWLEVQARRRAAGASTVPAADATTRPSTTCTF